MYQLGQNISKVETDYGIVLLDEARGEYFNLNPSGVIVLETVLASGDPARAVTALLEQYSVERDVAEADVADVLGALVSAGVLKSAT
ncbi:lasso peptide biosynthesis PqqD family chaperone [Actinomadura sp. 6N118]|uniref:lasso peptide biosynthesis PqqD family chaperone n=1 Tax=Actinomadura sp. 6N118 TaxID=3375151 RepID=UPI00379DD7F7